MTDNTPLFNIPSGSIQIGDRMHEETGVIGRSTSGSPVESSPHFHIFSFPECSWKVKVAMRGNQRSGISSHVPEEHTAFDQSPLSAVVKGCVLGEIFGPNMEADVWGGELVQPGRR